MRVWVAAVVAALAVPGIARGATIFLLDGGGWGHGVGMSQWGAEGYALHGYDYKRILAHYYPHTTLQLRHPRPVRVLLRQKQTRVRISSPSPFLVLDARGRKVHFAAGETVVVNGRFTFGHLRLKPPVRFRPGAQPLTLGGDGYRGDLVVKPRAGGLMVVNVLPLDRYLRGVVPWEVPTGWEGATYEAQAVAARSYTLATLHPHADFDLYPDDRSQEYGGIRAESEATNLAIGATAGQVLTYGGAVITAYYSSTSGGRTAAVQDGFPGEAPEPYLVSVADPYDSISPHHKWPTRPEPSYVVCASRGCGFSRTTAGTGSPVSRCGAGCTSSRPTSTSARSRSTRRPCARCSRTRSRCTASCARCGTCNSSGSRPTGDGAPSRTCTRATASSR